MRLDPQTPWSEAHAFFRWPTPKTGGDATLLFLYDNRVSLMRDYDRSARWKHVKQARALTCSLYIEKTTAGETWCNFGRRTVQVANGINGIDSVKGVATEAAEERIAVYMPRGGKNRRGIAKEVRTVAQLWVIFASHDPENPDDFGQKLDCLNHDCLAAEPDTVPILLSGLSILGQFFPTRLERLA